MPPTAILPSSAAAFTPRAPSIVVLNDNVSWLVQIFKRVNLARRPLNNLKQRTSYLSEKLSSKSAIWALCSVMLENTLGIIDIESWSSVMPENRPWMIHIEAYVVHVDMVSRSEVAFKLTEGTINDLKRFYEEFQSVDAATYRWNWPEKQAQLDKLHKDFVEAVNKFVYRTHVKALEGLEEDGSGELLCGCSEDVKAAIFKLFVPLMPPPRVVHFLRPVVPFLSGTKPAAHVPIHLFDGDKSRSTQSNVRTPSTKNLHDPSLGYGLDAIDAASPIHFVGSPLFISARLSYPSNFSFADVSLNHDSLCGAFGGSPSSFC
ncbi:uncharacterized protein N7446_007881 [Penicillium canescens]|uniref:Uncharacterized protein n=1 Tax=Penicillium canescens TaxID=5083 RepID=A0AAD6NDT7_PENCN|nr:uncharacterized protein N7446_007881 [Penicillium canescens]KAJ6033827.1 hypothetical protein N7444_011598 [Penicillium canescens]KAJ6056982.1 hypothetical protein N7460_000256 [Penicillium canescens]KAJ6058298.1 hypothetical protein N7446_007881 [Penicillium canescens]